MAILETLDLSTRVALPWVAERLEACAHARGIPLRAAVASGRAELLANERLFRCSLTEDDLVDLSVLGLFDAVWEWLGQPERWAVSPARLATWASPSSPPGPSGPAHAAPRRPTLTETAADLWEELPYQRVRSLDSLVEQSDLDDAQRRALGDEVRAVIHSLRETRAAGWSGVARFSVAERDVVTALSAQTNRRLRAARLEARVSVALSDAVGDPSLATPSGAAGGEGTASGVLRAGLASNGDAVAIPGLGTFWRGERPAYSGVNPRTGAVLPIPARVFVRFRAAPELKDALGIPLRMPDGA